MCADRIPEEIAFDGRLKRQIINHSCYPELSSVFHTVENVNDLVTAIASFEGIVTERVRSMSQRNFAWIQICRTYFYTMLHASWLKLRSNFKVATTDEIRNLENFISNKNFNSSLLPKSIANEIVRISIPSRNPTRNTACFPSVRPGLLTSKLFTDPATGLRTRHVYITNENDRLPSVLLSQNMTWLLANRHTTTFKGMTMNKILCALINGSFEPTEFIINDGEITEDMLFNRFCYNPALAVPPRCLPSEYAMSFDLIKSKTIASPIDTNAKNSPTKFSLPTWLEPQLTSTMFDACYAIVAQFLPHDETSVPFDTLEFSHALLDFDDAYNLYVQLRSASKPYKPNFDSTFWLEAIHTRATGSA